MPTYLIIGASRGIGGTIADHLAAQGAEILSVSRSPSTVGTWIEADIGTADGIGHVVQSVGERCLDGLLFLGGIWEEGAFTDAYDFLESPAAEIRQVLAVNLTAPILLAQALARNLAQSENARIVLMGSTSGLPNTASPEVANTAAKFGLQGAAEALNVSLRSHGIATTVINPANVATAEVEDDIAEGRFGEQVPIPLNDMAKTIDYVLQVSAESVPSSITLCQKWPAA
ncbi:MAG: SDR family oxidoreductase [Pseudomonadota bacterium]